MQASADDVHPRKIAKFVTTPGGLARQAASLA